MSKKILIIRGSARESGFTNALCDYASDILSGRSECEIKVFNTFFENFEACDGCNFCEKHFCCRHGDLDPFFADFENADLIIFASPVYNGTFSAPMKALIDRFQVYYTAFYAKGKVQPIQKKRRALLFAASGRSGETAFNYMKTQLASSFSILNIEFAGAVLCPFTDTVPLIEEAKAEIRNLLCKEEQ